MREGTAGRFRLLCVRKIKKLLQSQVEGIILKEKEMGGAAFVQDVE